MKKHSEQILREIEKKIGYSFKDRSLLIQAFTRTSFCNETNLTASVKYHSNEVLEFFGDGVLSLSIISFLLKECTERYEHGIRTELGEGDFSNIKSKLSDKQNLSKSMKALGLEKYLLMGEGDEKLGIQNEPSVMEDLFESIVGAIFIDSGMNINAVITSVSGMLDMSVYTDRQTVTQSAKNALQEWCADKKRRLPAPRYETLSEDGPDHKKTYVRGCYIGDKLMGRGIGKNFKIADSAAAEDALKALMAKSAVEARSAAVHSGAASEASASISKNTAKSADVSAIAQKPTEAKTASKTEASIQKKTAAKTEASQKKTVKAADNGNTKKVSEDAPKATATPDNSAQKKKFGASVTLKNYATSNKKPSPTFRDLGERKNAGRLECAVECSFMGKTALGVGATRLEAREAACHLMVEMIGIGKKKKPNKSTSAQKPQDASEPVKLGVKAPVKKKKSTKPADETKVDKGTVASVEQSPKGNDASEITAATPKKTQRKKPYQGKKPKVKRPSPKKA